MTMVSNSDIIAFVGNPSVDNNLVYSLRDAAESIISAYCRRNFEFTTYTLEKYSGNGTNKIYLKNYPVITLHMISIGSQDCLAIYNSDYTFYASVTVSSGSLVLNRDGSVDESISLTSHATLGSVNTAVNAVGNGWSSNLVSPSFSDIPSSFLIPMQGIPATSSTYAYLQMPNDPETSFDVNLDVGIVYLNYNSPIGINNIFVTYSAGYSSIPSDLSFAVKILVKQLYDKKVSAVWGIASYSIGDISYRFDNNNVLIGSQKVSLPPEVSMILSRYRRRLM